MSFPEHNLILSKNKSIVSDISRFAEQVHSLSGTAKAVRAIKLVKSVQEDLLKHLQAVPELRQTNEKISEVLDLLQNLDDEHMDSFSLDKHESHDQADQAEVSDALNLFKSFSNNYSTELKTKNLKDLKQSSSKFTSKGFKIRKSVILEPIVENKEELQKEKESKIGIQRLSDVIKTTEKLGKVFTFECNIFDFDELFKEKTLPVISSYVFKHQGFFELGYFKEDDFFKFAEEVAAGYDRKIVYHNDLHAIDVFQTVYNFLCHGDLGEKLNLADIDMCSLLLAALCHDFGHPGFNNHYQVNAITDLAIQFNDVSVLENYHSREGFRLIQKTNLLSNLSKEEFKLVRRRFIDSILATDMANHAAQQGKLKTKIELFDIFEGKNIEKLSSSDVSKKYDNQQMVLDLLIHTADVSNPAKPFVVYKKWVDLVFVEFFAQGDLEKMKGLPVTILCDRETTSMSKSQIFFINLVVKPTFETLAKFIPEVKPYQENIELNHKLMEERIEEEEKRKKSNLSDK
mmetsp:Transcript_31501/g.32707  ORF Transcript_31501/g.32707 Transcript_31501/m.32707 type:complete len:515 (+) Transcript_31501:12-1556(+)